MPKSLTERLSRFTPDATGLDRDALLFAAGRASARPKRGWMILAGSLAVSQLLTLALLWPRPTVPVGPLVTAVPASEVAEAPALPPPSDGTELWSLSRRMFQSEAGDLPPPAPVDQILPDNPPLHAFSSLPSARLE